LDEVISGAPRLMRPFIEEARYAAEHRNHYWEHARTYRGKLVTGENSKVKLSTVTTPYPRKNQQFNDKPVSDEGGNFGRVARGGLMTGFIEELLAEPISGIPATYWQSFLKIFAEGVSANEIEGKLASMRQEAEKANLSPSGLDAFDRIQEGLKDLISKV
jgi:hypothetical protein